MTGPGFDSEQFDPGVADDERLDRAEPLLLQRLYLLSESQHWQVSALSFERDRTHWAALGEEQRAMLLNSVAPFFAGEERVATVLAPIILAAEDEHELAFLATQQADEARHMQFFDRFWREVLDTHDGATGSAVADARARCNDAFTELFDRRLMQALSRLRLNPRDGDAKLEAVTIYHLVVEATMGLTGMHFLLDYFVKHGLFPGITSGLRNVERDEHRHVAYGTWFLRKKCREQDRHGFLVSSTMMELLPVAASVIIEGGQGVCDGLDPVKFLDYASPEVNHFALVGLSRRLKVIGGATDEIQRFVASGAWRAARFL